MFWAVVAYLMFTGLIGHIDVLFLRGMLGVYVASYLPWNK